MKSILVNVAGAAVCVMMAVGCSATQSAAPRVRFDGCYATEFEDEPSFKVKGGIMHGCNFLRFYADGTEVSADVLDDAPPGEIVKNVIPWLKRSSKNLGYGIYVLRGDQIRFIDADDYATVVYGGTVSGDRLLLHFHSRTTGKDGEETFDFHPVSFPP